MAPSRDNVILGILSILFFIFLTNLLLNLPVGAEVVSHTSSNILSIIISSFNISVLLGYLGFGSWGGIILTCLAALISLVGVLRSTHYQPFALTLTFIVANLLGYNHIKAKSKLDQSCSLRMEKLYEEFNILSNSISEKKARIMSLEEKLERYTSLKDVAESLSSTLSIAEINNLIIEKTLRILTKKGRMLIFLVDMEKQELALSSYRDNLKTQLKKGDFFDTWVLKHRKSLMIEDIAQDFRFPTEAVDEAKKTFRSMISAPLVSEGKVIGILRMDSPTKSYLTQEDLRVLDIICGLAAVALQNAVLYSKTQELAIRDGLTGLYVRRYFMERLQEETKRTARSREGLSLLMLDIDHFKSFNDKYGHIAGDLVLKHLSQTIRSVAKDVDILARYGGEEMALLLIGTGKEDAKTLAEELRRRVEDKPFILRRNRIHLTVSVGVSNYPTDALSEEELIRIADERLYRAKSSGRNKVCSNS